MIYEKKYFFLLFLLLGCAVPLAGNLINPYLNNPDTYYFFFHSCGSQSIDNQPFLTQVIWDFIPCSELVYKVLPFFLLFFSSLIIWMASKELYKGEPQQKYYSFVLIGLFLTPIWSSMFFKFENDVFAYFTLALATYFFVRNQKQNNGTNLTLTLIFLVISGLIWEGSFYVLLAMAFNNLILAILTLTIIFTGIVTIGKIIAPLLSFISIPEVTENAPVIGWIMLLGLNLVTVALNHKIIWTTLFLILVAFLNVKLALLAVPFLALSFPNLVYRLEQKNGKEKAKQIIDFFLIFSLFIIIFSGIFLVVHPYPSPNLMEAVEDTVEESEKTGLPIYNDWHFGYYLRYFGEEVEQYGHPQGLKYDKNSLVLTIQNLEPECTKHKEYYRTIVDLNVTLWKC